MLDLQSWAATAFAILGALTLVIANIAAIKNKAAVLRGLIRSAAAQRLGMSVSL